MSAESLRVALRPGIGFVYRTGRIVLWSDKAEPELWEGLSDHEVGLTDLGRLVTGSEDRWIAVDLHELACAASCNLLLRRPGEPHSLKLRRRTINPLRDVDGLQVGGVGAGVGAPESHLKEGTVPAGGFVLLRSVNGSSEGPMLEPEDMSPIPKSSDSPAVSFPETGPATLDFQSSGNPVAAPSPLRRPGEARPGLNRKRQSAPKRFSIQLDDGRTFPIGAGLVVGRNPVKGLPDGFEPVTVSDEGVSRVHWQVWPNGDGELLITDRESSSGTVIESASGEVTSIGPGAPAVITTGATVLFANRRATVVAI